MAKNLTKKQKDELMDRLDKMSGEEWGDNLPESSAPFWWPDILKMAKHARDVSDTCKVKQVLYEYTQPTDDEKLTAGVEVVLQAVAAYMFQSKYGRDLLAATLEIWGIRLLRVAKLEDVAGHLKKVVDDIDLKDFPDDGKRH